MQLTPAAENKKSGSSREWVNWQCWWRLEFLSPGGSGRSHRLLGSSHTFSSGVMAPARWVFTVTCQPLPQLGAIHSCCCDPRKSREWNVEMFFSLIIVLGPAPRSAMPSRGVGMRQDLWLWTQPLLGSHSAMQTFRSQTEQPQSC